MYIADLHIHSRFSMATSRDCDLPHLDLWARNKGIQLVGTGDFTHPQWRREMADRLIPAEEGLYTLREEYTLPGPVTTVLNTPSPPNTIFLSPGTERTSILQVPSIAAR